MGSPSICNIEESMYPIYGNVKNRQPIINLANANLDLDLTKMQIIMKVPKTFATSAFLYRKEFINISIETLSISGGAANFSKHFNREHAIAARIVWMKSNVTTINLAIPYPSPIENHLKNNTI